jgi:hypothetical protein
MDLIERYVKAVESYLPVKQPKDIVRELEENLRAQMEDEAERMGRPLTEEEQARILKQTGNPALVAGRYQTSELSVAFGRQLIGPGLFPLYARVLGIVLVVASVARILVGLWLEQPVVDTLLETIATLVWPFAIVTAVFASIQSVLTKNPDLWNVWNPMEPPTRVPDSEWVSRLGSVVEFVVIAGILLWLRSDWVVGMLNQIDQNLGQAWRQAYLLLVLLTATGLVPPLVNLVRPRWEPFQRITRWLVGAVWVVGLVYLIVAGDWGLRPGAPPELGRAAESLGRYVWYGILLTAAGGALALAWDGVVIWRRRRR